MFQPRTPLGKKLLALREQYIASGGQLLSEEEILMETAELKNDSRYNRNNPYLAAAPWFALAVLSAPAAWALFWADTVRKYGT